MSKRPGTQTLAESITAAEIVDDSALEQVCGGLEESDTPIECEFDVPIFVHPPQQSLKQRRRAM